MGILNVTPDSFSDGGKYFSINSATEHALEMLEDGADIIDIGGESSRPGAEEVSIDEEISRTIPVIESIFKHKPNTIISIDTTKSEVAEAALQCGVKIINDISGLSDAKMLEKVKKYYASIVVMHMQGKPRTMQESPKYKNVFDEVFSFLKQKIELSKNFGVSSIIIDPGIGFGKSVNHNYELLRNLAKFQTLETPLLIGVSRKSLIGKSLNLDVENRDIATIILETDAITKGAKIVRTHNVKNAIQLKRINKLLTN
ncbi:MAG: dihydropteroate synthase [Bacteroidetes bacterium]|nr:dihydropteroate synthase [Bacteroidota bacterium]MBU1114418.1 dihydropteroate synthase [Bacteroidota bacterium]MBU1798821.1 dihydropteroate synthase [Bacteroidota bacterium]